MVILGFTQFYLLPRFYPITQGKTARRFYPPTQELPHLHTDEKEAKTITCYLSYCCVDYTEV